MKIEDIKTQLETHARTFPEAAVRAAMAQREAMTPLLLECLQTTADEPHRVVETDGAMLHMYAMYLLAQGGEGVRAAGRSFRSSNPMPRAGGPCARFGRTRRRAFFGTATGTARRTPPGAMAFTSTSCTWIDFRGIRDAFMREKGCDSFENSRRATEVQREYAIRNPRGIVGYGEDGWGRPPGDPHSPWWLSRPGRSAKVAAGAVGGGEPSGRL